MVLVKVRSQGDALFKRPLTPWIIDASTILLQSVEKLLPELQTPMRFDEFLDSYEVWCDGRRLDWYQAVGAGLDGKNVDFHSNSPITPGCEVFVKAKARKRVPSGSNATSSTPHGSAFQDDHATTSNQFVRRGGESGNNNSDHSQQPQLAGPQTTSTLTAFLTKLHLGDPDRIAAFGALGIHTLQELCCQTSADVAVLLNNDRVLAYRLITEAQNEIQSLGLSVDWSYRMRRLYDVYNPSKVAQVPSLMTAYVGQEVEMWQALREKYEEAVAQEAMAILPIDPRQPSAVQAILGRPQSSMKPTTTSSNASSLRGAIGTSLGKETTVPLSSVVAGHSRPFTQPQQQPYEATNSGPMSNSQQVASGRPSAPSSYEDRLMPRTGPPVRKLEDAVGGSGTNAANRRPVGGVESPTPHHEGTNYNHPTSNQQHNNRLGAPTSFSSVPGTIDPSDPTKLVMVCPSCQHSCKVSCEQLDIQHTERLDTLFNETSEQLQNKDVMIGQLKETVTRLIESLEVIRQEAEQHRKEAEELKQWLMLYEAEFKRAEGAVALEVAAGKAAMGRSAPPVSGALVQLTPRASQVQEPLVKGNGGGGGGSGSSSNYYATHPQSSHYHGGAAVTGAGGNPSNNSVMMTGGSGRPNSNNNNNNNNNNNSNNNSSNNHFSTPQSTSFPPGLPPAASSPPRPSAAQAATRKKLVNFYLKHAPEKVELVDTVMQQWVGREEELERLILIEPTVVRLAD